MGGGGGFALFVRDHAILEIRAQPVHFGEQLGFIISSEPEP
jgi:hypothetical protein